MKEVLGREALIEIADRINNLETHVLKVENNHVSDAYTKEESDNKYLRKGNYATLADVQSNNVKVINLTDYQDKELPIKNAEPFFCKITDPKTSSIFGDLRNVLASHYRWVLNIRIDCFLHDAIAINDDPSPGVGLLYSIIIGDPTGGTTKYKMYGFLRRNANKEWEFVKTDLRTVIDNIEGSSALEFAEMIVPLFGEDLPNRVDVLESELGKFSRVVYLEEHLNGQPIEYMHEEDTSIKVKPFTLVFGGLTSNYFRMDYNYRFDCWSFFPGYTYAYTDQWSILKMNEEGFMTLIGFLLKAKDDTMTLVDARMNPVASIDGKTKQEWTELILPLFHEDLPERMENAEQKLTEIGNLSQINLPNDRDSLVDSINRLTKRTEVLMNRIEQLETELNYTPMIQEVVGKDPWTGELKNMDIEIQ